MEERTRSFVDVESSETFNTGNPAPRDESLVSLLSNPLVPPLEVDHHRSSCCLSSFDQSMRAMLTLVLVFMLFNLTSIWNLLLSQQVIMGMMESLALLASVPSSSSMVMLAKWPHKASLDGGSHP
jgi:hypothetical protein